MIEEETRDGWIIVRTTDTDVERTISFNGSITIVYARLLSNEFRDVRVPMPNAFMKCLMPLLVPYPHENHSFPLKTSIGKVVTETHSIGCGRRRLVSQKEFHYRDRSNLTRGM